MLENHVAKLHAEDNFLRKENDSLHKENESLRKENDSLHKENDSLRKENDKFLEEKRVLMEKRNVGTLSCAQQGQSALRIHEVLTDALKQFKSISRTDMQAKAEQEQISLVGSKVIYDRLNEKMRYPELDPYFIDEQLRLYRWREAFFCDTYGAYWDRSGCEPFWYTVGADDAHCSYTIPFQITEHFDKVVQKASLIKVGDKRVHFKCDEVASEVHYLFGSDEERNHGLTYAVAYCNLDLIYHLGATFSQVAHMIESKCACGPNSLQHQAMKAVLANNLPLEELPETLQLKATEGMYSLYGSTPKNLTEEGTLRLEIFKIQFMRYENDNHQRDDIRLNVLRKALDEVLS